MLKDDKDARVVPALLHSMGGNVITATIQVLQDTNTKHGFVIYAEDMYDTSMATTSNSESSPNPDFPSIDLSEVCCIIFFRQLLLRKFTFSYYYAML